LPTVAGDSKRQRSVPYRLHHLFWNADPNDLDTDEHGGYIAQRLLSSGDLDGLAWGAEHLPPGAWEQAAGARGLPARTRALAANLAAAGVEHPDEGRLQRLLDEPQTIGDVRVAGIRDLAAMKLHVISARGELRDYYDLQAIEQRAQYPMDQALGDYLERYAPSDPQALTRTITALGYLDDIPDDPGLPADRAELAVYWRQRQRALLATASRHSATRSPDPPRA